jgi:magnesium transporter
MKIRRLLSYEQGTAGSIMQTEFLALPETETVANAISIIRRHFRQDTIFYLYTVDEETRLAGVVPLRQLLVAEETCCLCKIANPHVIKVSADEDQEKVAAIVYRYDLLAVPVVDSKNFLIGIITVDDVMDVIEEEVSEDAYKLAGSDVEEMVYGNRIFKISNIRLPWLLVSAGTGMVTALIIGMFSHTLEAVIALTAFIPVIAGMSGNVGTQSAAITVRGLAVGRVSIHAIGRTVFREMRVGFILGLISSILVMIVAVIWMRNPALGLVICASMLTGMTIAATSGAFLPMMFSKLGIDPAVASGPLVTTLNDCTAVIIYLSVATGMLHYLI